jgi:Flp pilus assembly protein TadD
MPFPQLHRAAGLLLLAAVHLGSLRGYAAPAEDAPRYVGAAVCAACHAGEYAAWKDSHHAKAMQRANPGTMLGDFSDARFEGQGTTALFTHQGDRFSVRTEGPDGKLHDYDVAYTFGIYPLQQYLLPSQGGRYQAFSIAWDSRPREQGGQRWFHLYPDNPPRAGDRLHWTGRDQSWNVQCAACHSTNLSKNFDLAADTYATTYSDASVACEACHGPGSRHVAWAQAGSAGGPLPDTVRKGLVAWLQASDRGIWAMDEKSGIARRTELPRGTAVLDACAGCHARRSVLTADATAATPFLDAYLPALLEPGLYYADGQIDGEVFEYGSFVQSRMFRAGVTCINCHDPHAGGRVAQGNALCAQCHAPRVFDTAEHHHHAPGSDGAQCAACHMPAKTYMGVDLRRDHSFRVPRPDLTLSIGVPNTCNQCHADRSADWAARTVAAWFPDGRQTLPHYGTALAAGRNGAADAEARLDALVHDPSAPGIARATAVQMLVPLATPRSEPAIRAALADPDPLVRMAAPAAAAALATPGLLAGTLDRLGDPVRAVRVQAARATASLDPAVLTPEQLAVYRSATRELAEAEATDADRPEAHMNLGLLAVRHGDAAMAEAEYRTALRLDPRFVPAMVNLADLDRMRGMDNQGEVLLRQAIAIEPGNADAHYALGLLLVRRHDPGALDELRQANALAPDSARYAYVYAVGLNGTGDAAQAFALLEAARRRHPADRSILSALISFAQQRGDRDAALRYARELAALSPDDDRLRALVRQLGGR